MVKRFSRWMHARGSARMITREGVPYLERFYLLRISSIFALYLHTFWDGDVDPPHDHPWTWGRMIVRGWYREHYHDGTSRICGPGHIVWRRDALTLHRVELLSDKVVTLFWHGPKFREWGFMLRSGWRAASTGGDTRPWEGFIFPTKVGPMPGEVKR